MSLEQELLDATGVKKAKFKDTQKMMAAVVKAVEKLPNDEYKALTDEAVDWYEAAVKAMNSSSEIPGFDEEVEGEEADADEGDEGAEADTETDEQAEEGEATESDEEAEAQGRDATATAPATEDEAEAAEADEEKPAKPKKAAKKAAKPKKDPKGQPPVTRYDNLSGKKNRYGCYEGTILADVCDYLEKGATMAQVKEKFGDTKYNLVNRLIKEGHHVEKEGAKYTLIHKDDVKTKGKKK